MNRMPCLAFALSFSLSTPIALACEAPTAGVTVGSPTSRAGDELRGLRLTDADGREASLGELVPGFARGTVVVLSMTEVGCPIAGKLAPRLERMAREAEARGVRF